MTIFFRRPTGVQAVIAAGYHCAAPDCRAPSMVLLSATFAVVLSSEARAQLLDRYFPANVPAYQDWVGAASAQEGDSIYGPLGVRVGSLVVSPSLTESVGYDSNPFGVTNGSGSAVVTDSGAVALNSDWSRNSVNAAFNVDRTDYFSFPRQSYTTWSATAGGLLNYGDDQIQAGYSHVYGVSLPTDIGTFGVSQPIFEQVDDIRLSDTIGPGRVTFVPAVVGESFQFSSGAGGDVTNLGPLYDRDAITASLTAGYEFSGGHNALIAISNTVTSYTGGLSALRPANYNDISIMGGVEYKQSSLLIYRMLAGFEERSAISSGTSRNTISAPAAELDLIWTPSARTTLTGTLSQSLQDAPTDIAQGLSETKVELALKQSVRSNVTVDGSVQYTRAPFQSSSQIQSIFIVTGEATWSLTRRLALSLRYEFTSANDTGTVADSFDRHQVLLLGRFQL